MLIIQPCNIYSRSLITSFLSWKCFENLVKFFFAQSCFELPKNVFEVYECYLRLVIFISKFLKSLDEIRPLLLNLAKELSEQLHRLILVHLLMHFTEVLVIFCGLETLRMLARVYLGLLRHILSEV